MRRSIFRLLAMVALIGLAVSCGGGGGGDGDDEYDFGGRWATTETVTSSTVPGIPVGAVENDIMIIAQNGNNVIVKFESAGDECTMQGSCDPSARTFSVSGVCSGTMAGIRFDIAGSGVDNDSLSGTYSMTYRGRGINVTWTADLVTRTLAASAPGAGAARMKNLMVLRALK